MSLEAFRDDPGTVWLPSEAVPVGLSELRRERRWRRRVRKALGRRPLVWFVDDEAANRAWFVDHHRAHLGVLTLSSREHCEAALRAEAPCDAVVTDIFFPAQRPATEAEAAELLEVYPSIARTAVSGLPGLWSEIRDQWRLDGFAIARLVTEHAARRKEAVPVLLFSRKATLLLGREDWLDEPATVRNTLWLLEKLDPAIQGEPARIAAAIQRERLMAAVRWARAASSWRRRLIRRAGLR